MPSLVLLLLVSLLSILTQVQAQTQYKDFIITGNSAWVLTSEGKISVIDLASKKVSKTIKSDVAIVHLARDRQGTIVVADNVNQLKTYNDATDSWQIQQTLTNTILGLVFDSQNRGYAITDEGIQDLATGQLYFLNIPQKYPLFPEDS